MPSQEPAVDDKDDDVDLPSEETGGSRAAPPPRNACPPPPTTSPLWAPPAIQRPCQRAWPPRGEAGATLSRPLRPGQGWVERVAFPGPSLRALLSRVSGVGSSLRTGSGSSTQGRGHVPAPPTDRLCTGHAGALSLKFCGIFFFFFWWVATFLMLRSIWREILIPDLMQAQL